MGPISTYCTDSALQTATVRTIAPLLQARNGTLYGTTSSGGKTEVKSIRLAGHNLQTE
jgi:hypothetical protein